MDDIGNLGQINLDPWSFAWSSLAIGYTPYSIQILVWKCCAMRRLLLIGTSVLKFGNSISQSSIAKESLERSESRTV